jgi:hypothetical protein
MKDKIDQQISMVYDQEKPISVAPFLLFFIVISIFGSLYANIQRKTILQDTSQKCNPRYVFFSGLLNPFQKDPWGDTERNFKKCVSTHMYKDPDLSKDIRTNLINIQEGQKNIIDTQISARRIVMEIKKAWENEKTKGKERISDMSKTNDEIFMNMDTEHGEFVKKTTQLINVLNYIIIYFSNIVWIMIGQKKIEMSIEENHKTFMKRYRDIDIDYKAAYDQLNKGNYPLAIYKAQTAIQSYNQLNKDIDAFREKHSSSRAKIIKGCNTLKQINIDKCSTIFPFLGQEAGLYIDKTTNT